MTRKYQVCFIRLLPLTVAFHSKNDVLIKMLHFLKFITDIYEICDFWLKSRSLPQFLIIFFRLNKSSYFYWEYGTKNIIQI